MRFKNYAQGDQSLTKLIGSLKYYVPLFLQVKSKDEKKQKTYQQVLILLLPQ